MREGREDGVTLLTLSQGVRRASVPDGSTAHVAADRGHGLSADQRHVERLRRLITDPPQPRVVKIRRCCPNPSLSPS